MKTLINFFKQKKPGYIFILILPISIIFCGWIWDEWRLIVVGSFITIGTLLLVIVQFVDDYREFKRSNRELKEFY